MNGEEYRASKLSNELFTKHYDEFCIHAHLILTSGKSYDPGLEESAVDEAFVTALSKPHDFLNADNPKNWIKTAIWHHCKEFLRDDIEFTRLLQRLQQFTDEQDFMVPSPYHQLALELDGLMSAGELWLFIQHYIERRTVAELSEMLGVSPSCVGTRIMRIKKRVLNDLKKMQNQ